MSEDINYTFEIILEQILVCEKRFSRISKPSDFTETVDGDIILDAIAIRLQAISEKLKRILKHDSFYKEKYPQVEWDKIIRFRDYISHHYELLDFEIIYEICKLDLPILKEVVKKELLK